jgi:hypothetical protein
MPRGDGTFGEHVSGEYIVAFSTARTIAHWPRAFSEAEKRLVGEQAVIGFFAPRSIRLRRPC